MASITPRRGLYHGRKWCAGIGCTSLCLRRRLIERRALCRPPAERRNDAVHCLRRKLLTMGCAGCARNALVHQRAAEVVGAGFEAGLRAADAHLHPRYLNVWDERVQREPRDRMHQDRLAPGRTAPSVALVVDWRLHVDEGQGDELGDATGPRLQAADREQMARPMLGALDMAEHDGRGGAQAHAMRGLDHVEPLLRAKLVRADDGAYLVVE